MMMSTSEQLVEGAIYTRAELRELFNVADATINNGIFHPKDTSSVWLFVTEEKTPDRVQYSDHLDGDVLCMQGQTEGRTDHLLMSQATNGFELLVFHRMSKSEHEGAGFRYVGPFYFIRHFGQRPRSFVLQRDTKRQFRYGKQTWRWCLEAVQQLGGCATKEEVEAYIVQRIPDFAVSNVEPDLCMMSVNDYGRSAWRRNRSPRRTDGGHPVDALYRRERAGGVVYELYDPNPLIHGTWELAADSKGVMRPLRISDSPELSRVQTDLEVANVFDAANDDDGRTKVLSSIARRQGQPKFRRKLFVAYEERCAVTGCALVHVLEGAHIKPYRGEHTNHVTNGLLLRADIHTLFDLGLLRVCPDSWRVEVAAQARSAYGDYHGQPIRLPKNLSMRPDGEAVRQHYERWVENFAT